MLSQRHHRALTTYDVVARMPYFNVKVLFSSVFIKSRSVTSVLKNGPSENDVPIKRELLPMSSPILVFPRGEHTHSNVKSRSLLTP